MYERVIILGSSRLAYDCAVIVGDCGKTPEVFDTNNEKSLYLEKWCAEKCISNRHITYQDLTEVLLNTAERTLLISAFNMYLIPEKVLDKDNLTAINCHHGILPDRPGRNCTTWAIFEQDENIGITWHYATKKADAGDILCIKKIALHNDMTAFQAQRHQYEMSYDGFVEIIDGILNDKINSVPQDASRRGTYRYSYDLPNDGFLDLNWDYDKMSAFLRSMDYGILDVLPAPRLVSTDGATYTWENYKLLPPDGNYGFRQENGGFTFSSEKGCIRLEEIYPGTLRE